MRENNRKPIEKCRKKLPQFTTMNVIDGQAGLVIYSSLIFYSLTIDNILNIIVLLILAGVSIATLTGENGILTQANEAKEVNQKAGAEEKVGLEVQGSYDETGKINIETLNDNLKNIEGLTHSGGTIEDNPISKLPATVVVDENSITIKENGSVVLSEWQQTGYQITNGEITLNVGDVVNYNELSNGSKNSEIKTEESGYETKQELATEDLGWRVLEIGENGGIELISDNPTTSKVGLNGELGYLNGVSILNRVCDELYGEGNYVENARCLNVEDINKLSNYNPRIEDSTYGVLYKYGVLDNGCVNSITSEDNGKTWTKWNQEGFGYPTFRMPGSTEIIDKANPKESEVIKKDAYKYSISERLMDFESILETLKVDTTQLLASNSASCNEYYVYFGMYCIKDSSLDYELLFWTNTANSNHNISQYFRPVVSLKSDIKLSGSSEEGWTITE